VTGESAACPERGSVKGTLRRAVLLFSPESLFPCQRHVRRPTPHPHGRAYHSASVECESKFGRGHSAWLDAD